MKKVLLIALCMAGVWMLPACSSQNTTADKTSEGKELVIGLDDSFAPMGFRDDDNDLVGFDIDLAQAVAEKCDFSVSFQPIDWSMKEMELNNKNIDLIWNAYSVTDARKEEVLFSESYLENRQVVVTMKDSPIESLQDLAGKNVAVQAESSGEEAVNQQEELKNSFGALHSYETYNDCFLDLEYGRTDAVVGDEVFIQYYIQQKGKDQYKIIPEDLGTEEYAIGARKEDKELVETINKALEEIKGSDVGRDISVRWFGENKFES